MEQTRIDSLMEALTNVAIGFGINFAANVAVLPLVLGVPVNLSALGLIGAIYTVISVVRSYVLRRLFNGRSAWQAIKDRFNRRYVFVEGARFRLGDKTDLTWPTIETRALMARQRVQHLIERP